nr:MAG TPA: hypothetical protein [Caudoviricetes sp.]
MYKSVFKKLALIVDILDFKNSLNNFFLIKICS